MSNVIVTAEPATRDHPDPDGRTAPEEELASLTAITGIMNALDRGGQLRAVAFVADRWGERK